jgi:hypothetical protein
VVTRARSIFIGLRIGGAALILAAVSVTFAGSWSTWRDQNYGDRTTLVANFFSFFTIDSNLATAVVFGIGAVLLARGVLPEPHGFSLVRAAVVVYMTITGVVYNLLLRGIPVTAGGSGQAWTNEVVHVVGPLLVILDWVLAPGRARLAWRTIPVLLVFPAAWLAYTLLRGPGVYDQVQQQQGWYPYPFLNPASSAGGYGTVAIYLLVITLAFTLVAAGVVAVSRRSAEASAPGGPAE